MERSKRRMRSGVRTTTLDAQLSLQTAMSMHNSSPFATPPASPDLYQTRKSDVLISLISSLKALTAPPSRGASIGSPESRRT